MAAANIVCALIAAGMSKRFDGNKLEAMFNGQMLGTFAARQLREANVGTCIAVTRLQSPLFNKWLASHGYTLIMNEYPDAGLSHSLALAAQAAVDCGADALLICLADMPFVPASHICALASAFARDITASSSGTTAMPPAIFPRKTFAKLTTLTGDSGARSLLDLATPLPIDPEWLIDIDTRADLVQHSKSRPKR